MPGRAHRGFTLIELLAALAVLALLASLSFRGISSIADAQARVRAELETWTALARFAEQMQHDLSLALEPPGVDAQGALHVRRRSDAEPASAGTSPRNVAFRVRAERLEYVRWPLAHGAAPEVVVALENVQAMELRALGEDGAWRPLLPPSKHGPSAVPRAIEARLTFSGGVRVSRVFALR